MNFTNRLTAKSIPTLSEGYHADGAGLYLQVTGKGGRSWIFRYSRNGKRREMGLGPFSVVKLSEAREKAHECRRCLFEGIDPIERKRSRAFEAVVDATKTITFREAAARYFAAHRDGWRSAHHAKRWQQSLAQYIHPTLGELPVRTIDVGLVMRVLQPIWKRMPESASRIRGRIESVLDWSAVHGYREGDNPARWKGHLDKLLPKVSKVAEVRHHAALPYDEIAAFMTALRQRDTIQARCLEFLILTATRPGEAVGARWSEIDLAERLWIIPASRMKAHREHRIPLSDAAMAVLDGMAAIRQSDYVFPGRSIGTSVSHTTLSDQLPAMGYEVTAHGFRSTFRDWAAERTNFPHEVCELALAHSVGNKTEAAYRRSDLFEKRRQLAESWARFCAIAPTPARIVPIRRR